MNERVSIDAWALLSVCHNHTRRRYFTNRIRTARDVDQVIRSSRKKILGSDFSLENLVRKEGKPDEEAIDHLCRYLAKRASHYLLQENPGEWPQELCEDYCYNFFFFSVQLYAHKDFRDECIDDLIRMAEAHALNTGIIATMLAQTFSEDYLELVTACETWLEEAVIDPVPACFVRCVTAAVATLTGVMPDPIA